MTSLPASDPGSAAVWGSKRINPRPHSCLCLTCSGCPSNDDDNDDGPSCDFDDTVKVEFKIQRQLQQLRKDGLLSPSVYKAIRSTRLQRPRLYGLPKTHKEDLLLRPTLSMIDSTQHSLAKWPTTSSILDPVLLLYFTN